MNLNDRKGNELKGLGRPAH